MTLKELTMCMYYVQQIRVFECDYFDRTKKTLIIEGTNHNLRSIVYSDFANRKVIGFGVGEVENTIDINLEAEETV